MKSTGPATVTSPVTEADDHWLVAIDLDGTTIDEHDRATPAVLRALERTVARGHHLVITTGRSPDTALRIVRSLGVRPEYVVCSNGAVILELDETTGEYRRLKATGFDASAVLHIIRQHLPQAHFAVENLEGDYRFTHPFPEATTAPTDSQVIVPFEELQRGRTARIIAIAPGQDVIEFRTTVERMRLTGVSYSLGWTSWLDVAPDGITKAAAAEEVRQLLRHGKHRVMAVGDGYNDVELLEWAGAEGRGVAMGHAPDDLKRVASEITGTLSEDGLAQALLSL